MRYSFVFGLCSLTFLLQVQSFLRRVHSSNYALTDDCDNRHARCQEWTMTGECLKNYNWMSENCRRSCGRCGRTRAQSCPGGKAERARPQPQQPPQNLVARTNTENSGITDSCYSPHCFNENMCCQLWGMQGECTRNPAWMNCNCRVACGKCRPSYEYGGCRDHHSSCPYWASMGSAIRTTGCSRTADFVPMQPLVHWFPFLLLIAEISAIKLPTAFSGVIQEDQLNKKGGPSHLRRMQRPPSGLRKWSKEGKCAENEYWMNENCRRSCKRCWRTRAVPLPGHPPRLLEGATLAIRRYCEQLQRWDEGARVSGREKSD
ncbi:hypothetical protein M3Y99_01006600 [Aphelenchoides fujianensis]|nr:hypothetical protein M3Y99_01006600 [Aphelenchoides fujianensis]